MILSVDNHPDGVQHRAIYRSSSSADKQAATLSKAEMKQARQMEARVANLKRRIATMGRLDDRFHEPDHGTGDLLVDSSFAVR